LRVTVRTFKDPEFAKWARREGLSDAVLCKAVAEIESGLIDARLGGAIFKKRVAAPGRGKSGGYRTIVAYRRGDRLFFLYGFAKNERENVTPRERKALIRLGDDYMGLTNATLARLIERGDLQEVECDEPNP
jgi:hypothetical protein